MLTHRLAKLVVAAAMIFGAVAPLSPSAFSQTAPGVPPAAAAKPAPDEPLVRARSPLLERIDTAIERGAKYQISHQNADGSWGEKGNHQAGETALITLSLLSCGESPQSPPLVRAIDFLKKNKSLRTYNVALHACVFASIPEALRGGELKGDLAWLFSAMQTKKDNENDGMYSYTAAQTREHDIGNGDFSNTQYGVLGVWYAAMAGLEVPSAYWKHVEDCWRRAQTADGGWGYTQGSQNAYASMTAAGAATLFITNDYLHAADARDLYRSQKNEQLELAIRWLGENFAVDQNIGRDNLARRGPRRGGAGPPRGGPDDNGPPMRGGDNNNNDDDANARFPARNATWGNYMLFGFERVGEASGLTRFGSHRWFDEGASYLLSRQRYDGSFAGDMGDGIDTAYALLFLSRGRSPVLMQKLQFGSRWNNRPLDVPNFVHFMRRATERHTNWQIVSIDAPLEDWREAPILYIASDRAIEVTSEQRDRLAEYVNEGGCLVFVNEGAGNAFLRTATALCKAIWPNYPLRDLPADHPIRKGNFPVEGWNSPIQSINNGIRDVAVFFPSGDASWKWQSNGGAATAKISPFAPLANLSLYLLGKAVPTYKGETTWIARDDAAKAPDNAIFIGRLRHGGNWNPEPLAWQRLANILHNAGDAELKVSDSDAAPDSLKQAFAFVHMTSVGELKLKPEEETAIKSYLDMGGLLVFDAAGSSPEAAMLFDALMARLYPSIRSAPLQLNEPVYAGQFPGGKKLQAVRYRGDVARDAASTLPKLRGFKADGRIVAIASNDDLGGALVGYTTAGVNGYTPSSAIALMRNVVLWAAQRTSPAAHD